MPDHEIHRQNATSSGWDNEGHVRSDAILYSCTATQMPIAL
jgi:hypothetical protein